MKRVIWAGVILIIMTAVVFFILVGLIYGQLGIDEARPADVIVVMGASQWSGKPSPVFKARLDHAHDLYKSGYAQKIILTGGVGEGEIFSESYIGKKYLVDKGIAAADIFLEETGRTSWQSLNNISKIIKTQNINSVILVSDAFHMMRLRKMANDLGIINYASPAKDSPIAKNKIIEFKYVIRESWVFMLYLLFKV